MVHHIRNVVAGALAGLCLLVSAAALAVDGPDGPVNINEADAATLKKNMADFLGLADANGLRV